jgi:hypothetical protein
VPAVPEANLEQEALAFAERLTATVRSAFGPHVPAFRAVAAPETSRFVVKQDAPTGIELRVDEVVLLQLSVEYRCTWDHLGAYLAVEESSIGVSTPGGGEPLFRFEYVRDNGGLPSAHLHLHAHRDALTYVMTACGERSRRGKRRSRAAVGGQRMPRLSEMHFPLGGSRYRPCLEDVLQMLIDELGVDKEEGALVALAEGRATWRRVQLAAAVRDSPEVAASVLEDFGYTVVRPQDGPANERLDRLQEP